MTPAPWYIAGPIHGLTGMSLGSPASIVASATFFATAVALAHLLAWL